MAAVPCSRLPSHLRVLDATSAPTSSLHVILQKTEHSISNVSRGWESVFLLVHALSFDNFTVINSIAQGTVTRPGLAPISAALAVELMVALLHHPLKHHAPADEKVPAMCHAQTPTKPLGCLPHQLRGYLSTFGIIQPLGNAFTQCTACSPQVCELYLSGGFNFLKSVCHDATYLEEVSGLTAFHAATEARLAELSGDDFGDDDDF